MNFSAQYLKQTIQIAEFLDDNIIEKMADSISEIKSSGGRLFFIGSGGGAGHASHAVCDFRKISNLECYTPSDNVSELTARVNDDGWDTSYSNWLKVSKFSSNDGLFIFSVGGGNLEKNISYMHKINGLGDQYEYRRRQQLKHWIYETFSKDFEINEYI